MIKVIINNVREVLEEGTTVAAAVAGRSNRFRRSVTGQPRGPVCGMGICFECRVSIDGVPHQRSCMIMAADGMEISTDE